MNLEVEKRKLNIKRCQVTIDELEYKILERMADIERIKTSIKEQEETINKINKQISEIGNG